MISSIVKWWRERNSYSEYMGTIDSIRQLSLQIAADLERRSMSGIQSTIKCNSCVYFLCDRGYDLGECRRFPPTVQRGGGNVREHRLVNRNNLCGEHQDFEIEKQETILPRIRKIREE